jgi:hypothetical protein
MMPTADEIVVTLAVGPEFREVFIEPAHQWFRMVTNGDVSVDEFVVVVAQEGAHLWETVFEVKEHRAAANERLKITLYAVGQKFVKLCEKLRLAAYPFEKRLRFNPTHRRNSGDGEIDLVVA